MFDGFASLVMFGVQAGLIKLTSSQVDLTMKGV